MPSFSATLDRSTDSPHWQQKNKDETFDKSENKENWFFNRPETRQRQATSGRLTFRYREKFNSNKYWFDTQDYPVRHESNVFFFNSYFRRSLIWSTLILPVLDSDSLWPRNISVRFWLMRLNDRSDETRTCWDKCIMSAIFPLDSKMKVH